MPKTFHARLLLSVTTAAILCCNLSCGGTSESKSLIDHLAWSVTNPDSDPLSSHQPSSIDCAETTWYEEDGTLEVQTGYCNYLSIEQPAASEVAVGDSVRVVIWHNRLSSEDPAEAHVALLFDENVVWEETVAMPTEAGSFDETFTAAVAATEDTVIRWHVHNHGYNTWNLQTLEVVPAN